MDFLDNGETKRWNEIIRFLETNNLASPLQLSYLRLVTPVLVAEQTFFVEVPHEYIASFINSPFSSVLNKASEEITGTPLTFSVKIVPPSNSGNHINTSDSLSSNDSNNSYDSNNSTNSPILEKSSPFEMPDVDRQQYMSYDPTPEEIEQRRTFALNSVGIHTSVNFSQVDNRPALDLEKNENIQKEAFSKVPAKLLKKARLNKNYSFETFIVGENSRFATACGMSVAESFSRIYNPLFVYGEPGLGKTHLLHAVGIYALTLNPTLDVLYINTEEFLNDFINVTRESKYTDFHNKYRHLDLLLVDDIQILSGKEETRNQFFQMFKALYDAGKNIIITSDVPPRKLPNDFEERLVSRFEWGLSTDMLPPPFETRVAILKANAKSKKIDLPKDVSYFIAENVRNNIRELEGALTKVAAYASLNKEDITLESAKKALKDQLFQNITIDISDIATVVAAFYHIQEAEILGYSRTQPLATYRQIAMYLAKELTTLSLPKIGAFFGGRDHTTIMHARKKIMKAINTDKTLFDDISRITTQLKSGF